MNREQVYADIQEKMGIVPAFFRTLPDNTIQLEWELMQRIQMDDGPIPAKYRELMGVAISATTKCKYCSYFHTQFAKLFGATDEEIQNAVHYAKSSAGWSTYINGLQTDFDQFKWEVDQVCAHVNAQMARN